MAGDDHADTVLIIEARDLTVEEYEQLGAAVMGAMLPLGLASRLRVHAAIDGAARRVMEAFDGT